MSKLSVATRTRRSQPKAPAAAKPTAALQRALSNETPPRSSYNSRETDPSQRSSDLVRQTLLRPSADPGGSSNREWAPKVAHSFANVGIVQSSAPRVPAMIIQRRSELPGVKAGLTMASVLPTEHVSKASAGRAANNIRAAIHARSQSTRSVIQRSPISWVIKKLGKASAVKIVKNYIKKNIKRKIKELTREKLKTYAKNFARDADEIIGILEDPWWMTAVELVPVVGDAVGGVRFAKQLDKVWDRVKSLERKIDAVLDKIRRIKLVEVDNLNKFRTTANNLAEQVAMKAAKSGQGRVAMTKLGDPRLKGMNVIKMEYTHADSSGKKIVIHYFRDLDLQRDFAHKFKN